MCKRRSRNNVSYRIKPLNRSLIILINCYLTSIKPDTKLFQSQKLRIWNNSDCRKHNFGLKIFFTFLSLNHQLANLSGSIYTLHLRGDHYLDAHLTERTSNLCTDIIIFDRQYSIHKFYQSHFDT